MTEEKKAKKVIDEHTHFQDLREAITIAFCAEKEKKQEALKEAIRLVAHPEYGFLMDRVEERVAIPFDVMRDKIYVGDFNPKTWRSTAKTLDAILDALKDNWSPDLLHRVVNHISESVNYQSVSGDVKGHVETLRDMIENSDVYKKSVACRTAFNDIFGKYNMVRREDFRNRNIHRTIDRSGETKRGLL